MSDYEGWVGGHIVHMDEGRQSSSVLGPDGEPVSYLTRQRVGFDLSPRKADATQRHKPQQAPHTAQQDAKATSGPHIER